MTQKRTRMSNIELLRIVSMFLIVTFHCSYKSGFTFDSLDTNTFIIKTFWLFGELGVNSFMLISGYFMINSRFKLKKLIRLVFQILFYFLISFFIAYKLDIYSLPNTKAVFFQLFFPTIMGEYWYATAYVLIYCLSPWLNQAIKSMNKKNLLCLIATLIIIWSIIPTLFGVFIDSTEKHLFYNRFIWFVVMYIIGAYIRLFPIKTFQTVKVPLLQFGIAFVLMCLAIIVISTNQVFLNNHIGLTEWSYFWTPNSVLMAICSIGLFGIFLNLKIPNNKLINSIASTTLGIYLIHDGPLQNYIWPSIFGLSSLQQYIWLPFIIIFSALIVFSVGVIIDFLRQLIEKITLLKILDSKTATTLYLKIKTSLSRFLDKLAS